MDNEVAKSKMRDTRTSLTIEDDNAYFLTDLNVLAHFQQGVDDDPYHYCRDSQD